LRKLALRYCLLAHEFRRPRLGLSKREWPQLLMEEYGEEQYMFHLMRLSASTSPVASRASSQLLAGFFEHEPLV